MKLREWWNKFAAVTSLPVIPPPKVPNKQQTLPGYRTQRTPSAAAIRKTDRALANTDLLSFRTGRDTSTVVRDLVASSPDISSAVSTYLRVGIPEDFTMIARNMDGSINPEGTALAHQLLRRFTFVPDYSLGFNPTGSLQSVAESLGKELIQEGACSLEVVLDKARLPTTLAPVAVSTLKFYEEDAGVRPVQDVGGVETDLDVPTFIYTSIDQDLRNAYASSYIESAIQPILADAEFTNDLRRVLKRAVHPRVKATILLDLARKTLPPEVLNDPEAYGAALNALSATVEDVLNGLAPEDALVSFDSVEIGYLEGQQESLADTFKAVQELLNAKIATGSKTMPAILGHTTTSNAASAETMLYLKHADLVRRKLNEVFSRAFTISVRLFGMDVYVEFAYRKLDLRPDGELEAYKSMEQSRVLMLLSLGMMPDDEACVRLTGQLPPAGYTPLAGTMFMASGQQIENPASGTSTMNKQLKPGTPAAPKAVVYALDNR